MRYYGQAYSDTNRMDLIMMQAYSTASIPRDEITLYPRDPPKNDVALFRSAATDNLENQRFCVVNHHKRGFERNGLMHNEEQFSQNHRKTQHFIRGKIPGGSHNNSFLYGKSVLPNKLERSKERNNTHVGGFLYGSSAIRRLEQKIPARRPNNILMLEEKMRDNQLGKHQKLAADSDNYLARYYEKKARQQSEIANEKKKDLEMLREYNPWGKPGAGAPRGYKNNEVDANVTNKVEKLKREDHRHKGAGGGGSPNRTSSGTVVTSLKMDPELRFQAAQYNTYIDPRLRYKPDLSYGKELDALVQDTINRKTLERRKNLDEEIRQVKTNPFAHGEGARPQKNDTNQTKSLSDNDVYDPWGKGFGGIPERKENGKIVKHLQGFKQDVTERPRLEYGSVNNTSDQNKETGNSNPKKKQTLFKNTYGQAFVRDFSPKETPYNPWGRPGAGAPLKDEYGHVVTNTTGRLAHDNTESSAQLKRDPVRKKEYLKSLEQQRREVEGLREEEKTNYNKPEEVGVADWVRQGKVGRPTYDALTKQIRANPKATSDVTREKFQIRRLKNDNSKCYYDDLQEMADKRHKRRQIERTKEQQLSCHHVATMNSFWGRPGGGAPVMNDQSRKHAEELFPTTSTVFR